MTTIALFPVPAPTVPAMPVASDASSTTPAGNPALTSAERATLREQRAEQRAERACFFLAHVSRQCGIFLNVGAGDYSSYLFGCRDEFLRPLRGRDLMRYLACWYDEDRECWLVFSCNEHAALLTHLRENATEPGLCLHGACNLDTARDLHAEVEVQVRVTATEAESTPFTEYADDAA